MSKSSKKAARQRAAALKAIKAGKNKPAKVLPIKATAEYDQAFMDRVAKIRGHANPTIHELIASLDKAVMEGNVFVPGATDGPANELLFETFVQKHYLEKATSNESFEDFLFPSVKRDTRIRLAKQNARKYNDTYEHEDLWVHHRHFQKIENGASICYASLPAAMVVAIFAYSDGRWIWLGNAPYYEGVTPLAIAISSEQILASMSVDWLSSLELLTLKGPTVYRVSEPRKPREIEPKTAPIKPPQTVAETADVELIEVNKPKVVYIRQEPPETGDTRHYKEGTKKRPHERSGHLRTYGRGTDHERQVWVNSYYTGGEKKPDKHKPKVVRIYGQIEDSLVPDGATIH